MFDNPNFPWFLTVVGGPIILGLGIAYGIYAQRRRRPPPPPPPGQTARDEYRH